ncbi:hypothetical protein H8E88_27160 [candidate division KSB1 bacterium]|nr:hypothetical protein [candidate division KSB1 bacterium]MBL7092755.1 hypothetical protein [candidate division KSB1 bacterium]
MPTIPKNLQIRGVNDLVAAICVFIVIEKPAIKMERLQKSPPVISLTIILHQAVVLYGQILIAMDIWMY